MSDMYTIYQPKTKLNMNNTTFEFQHLPSVEEVRQAIIKCESRHTQQCAYSTFHDALTQVCFGCKKIRSSLGVLL